MQVRIPLSPNVSPHLWSGTAVLMAGVATLTAVAAPKKPAAPAARASAAKVPAAAPRPAGTAPISISGPWQEPYRLKAGEAVEISVRLNKPSALPANGRISVEWVLDKADRAADVVATPEKGPRAVKALEIYTAPTANWRKVLHALDGDVFLTYRAPVTGRYLLKVAPLEEDNRPVMSRWREKGTAPEMFPVPTRTPWPQGVSAPITVAVKPIDLGSDDLVQKTGTLIEAEPNDTPEQAQSLVLQGGPREDDVRTYEITGSADDVDFFDNQQIGQSGDDWFRVELKADGPRLVTAQLGIPGQFLAARIRCYKLADGTNPNVPLGALLPVTEFFGKEDPTRQIFTEGKLVEKALIGPDPNERAHQQEESHRANINRILEPGKVYYFRVEANAPGYQLQLRVLKPAPYTDARMAIRQAMYTHIGQVDAWLTNRPRGASIERRIRDSGNLLGTQCMSCHTQSGIWGPSVPVANGYKVENVQSYWHLLNVMYECLRPTNELKDAANNTSLAPLDIGDGPAGTRAAGFNIVQAEKIIAPKKLHSKQQIRTANFVLQTADPSGINAAGKGSNVGLNIVLLFTTEILNTAWKRTGDPKYFRPIEDRARRVLSHNAVYTDDVAVRMDFFGRVFPIKDYVAQVEKAIQAETAAGVKPKSTVEDARKFVEQVNAQLKIDEARLRQIQNPDGSWGFSPGSSSDDGKTWTGAERTGDPSPTSLAISALTAIGGTKDDPAIAKAVKWMLSTQDANGRWNRAAITGFVPTAYALNALGRLYPVEKKLPQRADFAPHPGDSLLATVKKAQAVALTGDPKFADLMLGYARHPSAIVRYWGMVGLGSSHSAQGAPALLAALKEPSKMVRDAAVWAMRQSLLDDHGWDGLLAAYEKGDDYTRESVMQVLGMRADAVMPQARVNWERLNRLFGHAMNEDPHPAVRAWATKAAWQWWVWNPPVRASINQAWIKMLERPEANALVENSNRYSSQALFIANGHKANGSDKHQYKELAALFEALRERLEKAEPETKSLLAKRLVAAAGTYYQTNGGDGGPGQMGYITPGSGALFGQAALVYLRQAIPANQFNTIRAGLEGAANVPHRPLQEWLIDYALKAPEELRQSAAAAVSDPRSAMLQAATELVEPLIQQVRRGANEPARRASLSDPVIKVFASVTWVIPEDQEQQRHFFDLMIPKFEKYVSPAEIAAMTDEAKKAEATREMDAAWYLADRLGDVLATNPDLHKEIVFQKYIPAKFNNALERHFWIRSVPWILGHKLALPEPTTAPMVAGQPVKVAPPDPGLVIKDRALQLYLDALTEKALPRTRAAAIRVSNETTVRKNSEVLLALANVLKFEKDPALVRIAENVVKQGSARFVPDLLEALKTEKKKGNGLTADGKVAPAFLEDVTYFRDYVMPELARVKRSDQAACTGCHAVPGRVPSFFLKPVDEVGYISAQDLLFNYREMQARVNMKDVEKSKILRKPLNVQDGTEDGHQGGRRYLPQDEGYQILKKWTENQVKLLQSAMTLLDPLVAPIKSALAGSAK